MTWTIVAVAYVVACSVGVYLWASWNEGKRRALEEFKCQERERQPGARTLLEHLRSAQKRSYVRDGTICAVGGSGRHYLIVPNASIHGPGVKGFCVYVCADVSPADAMLALLLSIEASEDDFLSKAIQRRW